MSNFIYHITYSKSWGKMLKLLDPTLLDFNYDDSPVKIEELHKAFGKCGEPGYLDYHYIFYNGGYQMFSKQYWLSLKVPRNTKHKADIIKEIELVMQVIRPDKDGVKRIELIKTSNSNHANLTYKVATGEYILEIAHAWGSITNEDIILPLDKMIDYISEHFYFGEESNDLGEAVLTGVVTRVNGERCSHQYHEVDGNKLFEALCGFEGQKVEIFIKLVR